MFLALTAGEANGVALAYRNRMAEVGLSAATVNRRLAALKSFVKLARTLGRVPWSVEIAGLKPEPRCDRSGPDPKARKKLWRTLAKGETPRAKRDRAIVALLFDLGLRRGEVCALDLADVDFRGGWVSVKGKGKREKQRVKLPAPTSRALGEWVCARGNEPGALFVRTDRPGSTERLGGRAVHRLCLRLGRAAKLDAPLRPHGLRHASVTAGARALKDPLAVRAHARHTKMETTLRYIDRPEESAFEVADAVARERA
jgi:integrase/recombinase XerC